VRSLCPDLARRIPEKAFTVVVQVLTAAAAVKLFF
jgi:hypothetical protein